MSTPTVDPRPRQQSTSHILKTGKRGNPFVKDTHDLFSTLVASLQLTTNSRFFRSYPNSFTTDDAAANLSSLRFSQSNRSTDPNDPSRIVTTTTTTTFSMNRDIAKGICQHFMDARLIENAADPLNPTFKERGIYQITPKGLHVLERFITKNGIHADHLVKVFTSQPICMKLLHLERRPTDDEIQITPNVINVVFKRFSGGRSPNYVVDPTELQRNTSARAFVDNPRMAPNYDRSLGVELQDVRERSANGSTILIRHVFSSTGAIDWLVDFSTCCGREEAAELLAHFVRYGLITLHIDRSKGADKVAQVHVRAHSNEPVLPGVSLEGSFKYGAKVTYRITDEGRRLSGVDTLPDKPHHTKPPGSSTGASPDDDQLSSSHHPQSSLDQTPLSNISNGLSAQSIESQNVGRQVLRDILHTDTSDSSAWVKDATSSSARLKAILGEPALRSLFRDFLRSHICEENLHYWIDVQEFRRRFATSSTAVGIGTSSHHSNKKKTNNSTTTTSAASAMEQHQEKLVTTALLIFNTYLAPGSPSELNIDHNLRADVISYMSRAVDEAKGPSSHSSDHHSENSVPALRATQVQALLRHYERIADHIYRLMATDQVPKFVRTERFLEILSAQQLDETRDSETTTVMTTTTTTTTTTGTGTREVKDSISSPAGSDSKPSKIKASLIGMNPGTVRPSSNSVPVLSNSLTLTSSPSSSTIHHSHSHSHSHHIKHSSSYKKLIGLASGAGSSSSAPSSPPPPPTPQLIPITSSSSSTLSHHHHHPHPHPHQRNLTDHRSCSSAASSPSSNRLNTAGSSSSHHNPHYNLPPPLANQSSPSPPQTAHPLPTPQHPQGAPSSHHHSFGTALKNSSSSST